MQLRFKMPSATTIIATSALVIAVGGGTAYAATTLGRNSVDTPNIVNHAVTNGKIDDGAIGPRNLSSKLNGELTGVPITTLGGTFVDHSGAPGSSSIGADGVVLKGTSTTGYAGISTDTLNGLTPADLSTISYTESYTAAGVNAEPYFKLKLTAPGGACGDDDVVYAPDAQSPTLSYPGETQTYNVTAPYSSVGVDNDAQPTDGNYATAIHSASNGAGHDVSNESICLAEIIFDGGSGADGGTATINDVSFAGNGVEPVTYKFGS